MTTRTRVSLHSVVPFYRDLRVLRILAQIAFVLFILAVGYFFYSNLIVGLRRFGTTLTFDFLRGNAGFALAESPIEYDPSEPYLKAFLVGILNTLRVIVVGIVLASLLGLVIGVARLSTNWLVSKLAQAYVEIFRNTPLLVQLFFWYFVGVLKLPRVRESFNLPGSIFLSNRGLALPWFNLNASFGIWLQYAAGGIVIALAVYVILGRLPPTFFLRRWRGILAIVFVLANLMWNAYALNPFAPTVPAVEGFNFVGGTTLSPEYAALLFGLVIYTGAFIAEIVRAGILAVPRGVNEASRALGLSYIQTLRLVTVPLALRVIIPPLTNQYLNLSKNSSLAIAIGYADVFYVGQTILNQSGQTLQVIVMIMVTYLIISLVIAVIMNFLNARFRLVER